MILLAVSSVLFWLTGCALPIPDADICVEQAQQGRQRCWNLLRDYEVIEGQLMLKRSAVPHFRPLQSTGDVDTYICTDPKGFAAIKAYIQTARLKCESN